MIVDVVAARESKSAAGPRADSGAGRIVSRPVLLEQLGTSARVTMLSGPPGSVATQQQGQVVLGPFDNDRPTARQSFRRFAGIDVDTVCFGHGQPLVGEETSKLKTAGQADEVPDPLGRALL